MTQPPQYPSGFQPSHVPPPQNGPYGQPNYYGAPQQLPQPPQPQSNVLGLIAFITALLGFVLTCLPFMFFLDAVVPVAAVILALTGLFMKDQRNFWSIIALCTAGAGVVLGVIIKIVLTIRLSVLFDEGASREDTLTSYATEQVEHT